LLSKLRDDQRSAKADLALIVSSALPSNVETFDLVDSVWVADPRFAVPLAIALRQSLIDSPQAGSPRMVNKARWSWCMHI
jgi:hypothetical protein